MATRVGRLFVDLELSSAAFTKGIESVRRQVMGFGADIGASLRAIGPALGIAALGAAAGLTKLVADSAETADRLSKLSRTTGISIETLSVLRHGARLAGSDFEGVSTALARLSKAMLDATRGTKEQVDAFAAVGISQKEIASGSITLEQALQRIADRVAAAPDGWQKVALAQLFFGRTGAALIPLLQDIAGQGMARLAEETRRLGLIFTKETGLAAEQLNDNMARLRAGLEGIGNEILRRTAPQLISLAEGMVQWAKSSEGAGRIAESVVFLLQELATIGIVAAGVFASIGNQFEELAFAAGRIARGEFRAATEAFVRSQLGAVDIMGKALADAKRLWLEVPETIQPAGRAIAQNLALPAAGARDRVRELTEALRAKIEQLRRGAIGYEVYRAAQAGASEEQQRQIMLLASEVSLWDRLNVKLGDAIPRFAELVPPMSEVDENLRMLNESMASIGANLETASSGAGNFGEQLTAANPMLLAMRQTSDILATGLTNLFEGAIFGGERLQDVLQNLLKSLADMILKALILRTLGLLLGGTSFGQFLGFGGGKQEGGPVAPRQAFLVGEQGPELFVPKSRGMIMPMSQAGAGMTVVYQIDARGADAGVEHRVKRALDERDKRLIGRTQMAIAERAMRTP